MDALKQIIAKQKAEAARQFEHENSKLSGLKLSFSGREPRVVVFEFLSSEAKTLAGGRYIKLSEVEAKRKREIEENETKEIQKKQRQQEEELKVRRISRNSISSP